MTKISQTKTSTQKTTTPKTSTPATPVLTSVPPVAAPKDVTSGPGPEKPATAAAPKKGEKGARAVKQQAKAVNRLKKMSDALAKLPVDGAAAAAIVAVNTLRNMVAALPFSAFAKASRKRTSTEMTVGSLAILRDKARGGYPVEVVPAGAQLKLVSLHSNRWFVECPNGGKLFIPKGHLKPAPAKADAPAAPTADAPAVAK